METIQVKQTGHLASLQPVLVGCVGSGDLEVMIEPTDGPQADINIKTSVAGSEVRWQQVINMINESSPLPAMRMDIHDFGATPGVIRLRIEQALELAQVSEVPA